MSRDWRLLLEDVVEGGELARLFVAGVEFEAFCEDLEKVAAVERQIFIIGEAAARLGRATTTPPPHETRERWAGEEADGRDVSLRQPCVRPSRVSAGARILVGDEGAPPCVRLRHSRRWARPSGSLSCPSDASRAGRLLIGGVPRTSVVSTAPTWSVSLRRASVTPCRGAGRGGCGASPRFSSALPHRRRVVPSWPGSSTASTRPGRR